MQIRERKRAPVFRERFGKFYQDPFDFQQDLGNFRVKNSKLMRLRDSEFGFVTLIACGKQAVSQHYCYLFNLGNHARKENQ